MASLRSTWTSIPADHKRAIGGDQGCPDEFKTIAQAADARSTPGDDVDPDTGEAVQPMQSDTPARSEEHTSELQSLMRISYAVFCLKKKNKKHILNTTNNTAQQNTI